MLPKGMSTLHNPLLIAFSVPSLDVTILHVKSKKKLCEYLKV